MSVTAQEIQALAQSEDDFRHELQIGKIMRGFRSNGLEQLQHGGAYNDHITNKPRQFDFRALIRRGTCELRLAVEGKKINPAAPIIVCGLGFVIELEHAKLLQNIHKVPKSASNISEIRNLCSSVKSVVPISKRQHQLSKHPSA